MKSDDRSSVLKTFRAQLRGDVITRLEIAAREDPVRNPEAPAYINVVQAAIRYFEALDEAREVVVVQGLTYGPLRDLVEARIRQAETELRAVIGWPPSGASPNLNGIMRTRP
jgi:hypothetical protein